MSSSVLPFDLVLPKVDTRPYVVLDSRNSHLPSSWLIILSPQIFFPCYPDLRMLFAGFNGITLSKPKLLSVCRLLDSYSLSTLQVATRTLTSPKSAAALVEAFIVITTLVRRTTAAQVSLKKLSILGL